MSAAVEPIKTKKVEGRRKVRYQAISEFLAEAERLASRKVRTIGNWSQGQIYEHLARSLDISIDGTKILSSSHEADSESVLQE